MAAQIAMASRGPLTPSGEFRISKNCYRYYTVPVAWAAPPTPQDSQTSSSPPQSPPQADAALPAAHDLDSLNAVDISGSPESPERPEPPDCTEFAGLPEVAAPLGSTPTITSGEWAMELPAEVIEAGQMAQTARRISPSSVSCGRRSAGHDNRMQQWLNEIPLPVSPQERYLQGLDPAADHPLHPRPLQVSAVGRQPHPRLDIRGEEGKPPTRFHTEAVDDKENIGANARVNIPSEDALLLSPSKKRHIVVDQLEEPLARKRTKMLGPVRRFSRKVSLSLVLSPSLDDENVSQHGRRRDSLSLEELEEAARQSENQHRLSQAGKPLSHRSSFRMSLSKRPGSMRMPGAGALSASASLRRMMFTKAAPPASSAATTPLITWADGRPDMLVNIALMGDALVGKSALVRRLTYGSFPQSYTPSGTQEHTLRLAVDDTRVQVNITEDGSARDPRHPSVLALGWYSVVVLCFDIGNQSSLQNLQKYRNEISMHEDNAIVVLVGLKKDCRHRLPPLKLSFEEQPAQVSEDEGQVLAEKLHCNAYFECSSLSSCEGIDELFAHVVRAGVDLQRSRDKKMARYRLESSVDKGMAKIADGVRSLFLFQGN